MKVHGRRLYAHTLRERRLLMQLGGTPLYAPRGVSPYLLARRLARAASNEIPDVDFVRRILAKRPRREPPKQTEERALETTSAQDPVTA